MAEVYPIEKIEDIIAVRRILTKWGKVREAELFNIGCHIGLRIGDLLKVTFDDVESGWLKVTEEKTGKKREPIPTTSVVLASAQLLMEWYKKEHPYFTPKYLFQSARSGGSKVEVKPISSAYFRKHFKAATEALCLEGNYSSHSLRKTFGYHTYKNTGDLSQIQKIFNHATQNETLAYIGVTRKSIHAVYHGLDLTKL